jgi:hypothetical protein
MTNVTENLNDLMTAKELEDKKILSQTTQWRERNAGRLRYYRIGNKILYHPVEHIEAYFKLCKKNKDVNTLF